jgi:hypothetical protein
MTETHVGLLGDELTLRLLTLRPDVRAMIEKLLSKHLAARMAGLDEVYDHVLRRGALHETAPEALPHLLALATSPRYPDASALLVRLVRVISVVDDPPRAMADAFEPERATSPHAAEVFRIFERHVSALLRVARTSTDPEASRAAARIVLHFPTADAELEPLLLALVTGARDADGRAKILYALARVQAARGGPFHPRIERALDAEIVGAEQAACVLALAEHARALDPTIRTRARKGLARLLAHDLTSRGLTDPRAWSSRLEADAIERARTKLG